MATTVTWTRDANNNYEVSSAEHLKQLMHKGALYTDAGSFPTDHWATGTNYIQTADIDLLGDNTDIKPIGRYTDSFFGTFDGGEFTISNWSYLDPEFATSTINEEAVGLFGWMENGTLKNIRLGGTWTIEGFQNACGFLVGFATETSSLSTESRGIMNIECDFLPGTFTDNTSGVSGAYYAAIAGFARVPIIEGLTLKGSVDFRADTQNGNDVGGVVGSMAANLGATLFQNLATFPSGIHGRTVGGVIGSFNSYTSTLTKCLNAMTGDISGSSTVGGVLGFCSMDTGGTFVNSMTGNISYTGSENTHDLAGAGGVCGQFLDVDKPLSGFMNFMTGDISEGIGGHSGGLFGYFDDHAGAEIIDSVNAMNGHVTNAIIGWQKLSNLSTTINTNTNFGLTFSNADTHGSSSLPSGLPTHVDFADLPYVTLDGTDTLGNTYDFDFVYANLSGSSSYSAYTHLVLHKGDICTPYVVDFDIPQNNTTVYATFSSVTTSLVNPSTGVVVLSSPSGFTIGAPPSVSISPRPVNIDVVIDEVPGAIAYKITYEGPSGGETTAISGVATLEHNIVGLDPGTQYIVKVYADTGSGYEVFEENITTTLPNVATNYTVADFVKDGIITLSSLPDDTISNIAEVMNELFNTGDTVNVSLKSNSDFNTSFINLGDTLSIKEISGVLLPFVETSGTGQDVNVLLSDGSTTVPIDYDNTVNTITVNNVVYQPGDSFILDGKKVSVVDY